MILNKQLKNMVIGAGRLFDFSGSYNRGLYKKYLETDPNELAARNIARSWERVGQCMWVAIGRFEKENGIKK